MKFFLDSANIDEIKTCKDLNLLDGITTNPTLMSNAVKSKDEIFDLYKEILKICPDKPVSFEVTSTEYSEIMKEAEKLIKLSDNVVVKIPIIKDGLKACHDLTQNGIMTNMTLCFSPMQALLCAKMGATFVSPFVGRVDDMGADGVQFVAKIRQIFDNYGYETQILAASVRGVSHVEMMAEIGCDVATMPLKTMLQLVEHPSTKAGLEKFLSDFSKIA